MIDDGGEEEYLSALINTIIEKVGDSTLDRIEKRKRIETAITELAQQGLIEFGYHTWNEQQFKVLSPEETFPLDKYITWSEDMKIWVWNEEKFGNEPLNAILTERGKERLNETAHTDWHKQSIYL